MTCGPSHVLYCNVTHRCVTSLHLLLAHGPSTHIQRANVPCFPLQARRSRRRSTSMSVRRRGARCNARCSARRSRRARCARDAAEMPPRCTRDAAEMQPECIRDAAARCRRDASEMSPRCLRDVAEIDPRSARKARPRRTHLLHRATSIVIAFRQLQSGARVLHQRRVGLPDRALMVGVGIGE